MGRGFAYVPGSCGELVQGVIDGQYLHVSFPIAIYGSVTVSVGQRQGPMMPEYEKLQSSVRLAFERFCALNYGYQDLHIQAYNPLPRGKGMASSSVDVCAGIAAVCAALAIEPTVSEVADIALTVEPTDGVFVPGVALFDHVDGEVLEELGPPCRLQVCVLDSGGEVDTIAFNARDDLRALNHAKEARVRQALSLVASGLRAGDPKRVAEGATLSAMANQQILCKPDLEDLSEASLQRGALGINTAHSGSVVGVLFGSNHGSIAEVGHELVRMFPAYRLLYQTEMVGGGITWGPLGVE